MPRFETGPFTRQTTQMNNKPRKTAHFEYSEVRCIFGVYSELPVRGAGAQHTEQNACFPVSCEHTSPPVRTSHSLEHGTALRLAAARALQGY